MQNNDLGLRFSYPSNWEVSDFDGTGYKQVNLEIVRSNESKPSYQHWMAVTVYPYENGIMGMLGLDMHPSAVEANSDIVKRFSNMTIDELGKIFYGTASKTNSNIKMEKIIFGGECGMSFEYTREEGYDQSSIKGYTIFTIKNNKIYMTNHQDTTEIYNELFPVVKKVIDSIEIIS